MTSSTSATSVTLSRNSNQALGIGEYAVDFMNGSLAEPAPEVVARTIQFFTDSVVCGMSALALQTNAPTVLRKEALSYLVDNGATVLGSDTSVSPEKAIVANCSAVREWDSNGTNFGYNPELGHTAGEFGHNDFYAVPVAAAQLADRSGADAVRGMICVDEIRGRLAEVFSLKSYRIDHVVHGAIASAAVYGAMLGATPAQIESAIGMFVAHYIPWRAIRAGHQLSDSKGASAAISTEVAILSMQRAMRGFVGPADIFRNPEAIWRQFEPTAGDSPFDLVLGCSGADFAVMGMHFKIGLYEHQSAGALQGLIDLLHGNRQLLESPDKIASIRILAYQPAFGIIGDPAKRDPKTRQSADHSMVYIVSTMLRKAFATVLDGTTDDYWKSLMLSPYDYGREALVDRETRSLMEKVVFEHGGPEYDEKYPDGIPTSMVITTTDGATFDSGLVMYPAGHARNTTADLAALLEHKFEMLGSLALSDPLSVITRLNRTSELSATELRTIYQFQLAQHAYE
jgi:2-methylcitrate dehydratase